MGPDRYALTWLDISNFVGLDIGPGEYHKGGWAQPVPRAKTARGKSVIKKNRHSQDESSTTPKMRAGKRSTALKMRAKNANLAPSTALKTRENEYHHYPEASDA